VFGRMLFDSGAASSPFMTGMRLGARRSFEFDAVETLSKFVDGGLPNAAAFSEIMGHTLVEPEWLQTGVEPLLSGKWSLYCGQKDMHKVRYVWSSCGMIGSRASRVGVSVSERDEGDNSVGRHCGPRSNPVKR
jgi:hypothetical protein